MKFRLTFKGVGSLSDGVSYTETALRDIDGDGHPDIIVTDGAKQLIVYRNLTGRTNMIRSVALPFGGHINISYEQTTPSYDLLGRRLVMSFGWMNEPLTKVQKVDSMTTAKFYNFAHKYENSNHSTATMSMDATTQM